MTAAAIGIKFLGCVHCESQQLPILNVDTGAVVVEHRYIGPIIGGAIGDGLVVR